MSLYPAGRGSGWVLGQMLLLALVFSVGIMFRGQWHSSSTTLAGAAMIIVSAYFGIAGVVALGRNITPFPHPSGRTQLVQHGIYRFVRHPLYTAVMAGSVGWALLWKSWPAVIIAAGLVLLLAAKARVEERALLQRFPGYVEYKRRVKAFIPYVY